MIIEIRLATLGDIPVIVSIERNATQAAHWSSDKYEEMFSLPVVRRLVYVACVDGAVKGFLIVRALGDGWEIENIAVASDALRHGVATRLLQQLVELAQAENIRKIMLEVRESNSKARSLYRKFGFLERATRRNYYSNPDESAVIYEAMLQ